jgi:hypothetical protein
MWARIWGFLDWCFFGPASQRAGIAAGTLRLLRYPYAVIRDLSRGDINLRAMGLVYTTQLRDPQVLRRAPRPGADRVRVLPPGR